MALAGWAARAGLPGAEVLLWLGVLLQLVPVAIRLTSPEPGRGERIGLLVGLGVGLYLVKPLLHPLGFVFVDEFQHLRTADDILSSGALFSPNPILFVSPMYPGMEIAVSALAALTGLDLFGAATMLLGASRLLLMLALYLFFERAMRSQRAASIAALLYTANPSYLFFHSMFAYESLGTTLLAFSLLAVAWRCERTLRHRAAFSLIAFAGMASLVPTHHLSSYALVGLLALWITAPAVERAVAVLTAPVAALIRASSASRLVDRILPLPPERLNPRPTPENASERPTTLMLIAIVSTLSWLLFVAPLTMDYLMPVLRATATQFLHVLAGHPPPRTPFRSYTGSYAPLWEQLTVYASVSLVLLGLPFGILQVWRGQRGRPLSIAMAATAVFYPVAFAFRLVPGGTTTAGRAVALIYIAVAFVLASGITELWLVGRTGPARRAVFACIIAVVFIGSAMLNWPAHTRLPGPFLVNSHTRSVNAQGLALAEWMRTRLGPDRRVVADMTNRLLLGSYGHQYTLNRDTTGMKLSAILLSEQVDPDVLRLLQASRTEYVVADRRLSTGLPVMGFYFDASEESAFWHQEPLALEALTKFDGSAGVSRVLDNGSIVVYDVAGINETH